MQRVRMSSHQSPVHNLDSDKDCVLESESLISGLPDDIALNCLLRLPVEFHPTGRTVCRRWRSLFGNRGRFFRARKEMGFNDLWLFVFCHNKFTGKIQWHVLDLVSFSWHVIPEMPCMEKICPRGLQCVSVPGDRSVVVYGGFVNLALKFDVLADRWSVMEKMATPRIIFAGGVIGGKVYVAGGKGCGGVELDSTEVMDPNDGGVWRPVASMGTSMTCYDVAVVDGKLYVTEGWFWPFYFVPRGQVYDPRANVWECMAPGLREGWTGSSVVLFERLFVVPEHERAKLKVYDSSNDTWVMVNGALLPKEICKPFVVNGCDDRIYVAGRNLYVAVGFIRRLNCNSTDEKLEFEVRWQVVEGPYGFSDLIPASAQIVYA